MPCQESTQGRKQARMGVLPHIVRRGGETKRGNSKADGVLKNAGPLPKTSKNRM